MKADLRTSIKDYRPSLPRFDATGNVIFTNAVSLDEPAPLPAASEITKLRWFTPEAATSAASSVRA